MKVTVAATQMACGWDREANIANAEKLIREAAKRGANIVLIQELFEAPYFCKDHLAKHFELALPIAENPAIQGLLAATAGDAAAREDRLVAFSAMTRTRAKELPAAWIAPTWPSIIPLGATTCAPASACATAALAYSSMVASLSTSPSGPTTPQ